MNSYEIDEKLKPVLRQMERNGAKLDVNYLSKMSLNLALKLEELEEKIYQDVGKKFNVNSPSQLANVLYKDLKIKAYESGIRRGKTHYSTSARALDKIKKNHSVVEKIIKYRELAKLKNTYVDPLPKLVDENNRLHTTYLINTSTGRLSSKSPNLQNIPIRTANGKKIRKSFIAPKEKVLLKADYSQIELRIMAHLADDKEMIEIFSRGEDIHTKTAEEMGCNRRTAKVVNFGIMYGMSAYGLSETLKITTEEAQLFIDKYFLSFKGVKKYIDDISIDVVKDGYVETLFGRKREIKEVSSSNPKLRNSGIRAAINTPVQGTAAEIIKLAMINIAQNKELQDTKMILQVHDELVFEVSKNQLDKIAKIIKEEMEGVIKLKVPILVDLEYGENWQETKEIN